MCTSRSRPNAVAISRWKRGITRTASPSWWCTAKNPVIDLVLLSDSGMLEAAQKGVIQPMDYSKLSNYKALYDVAKNPIGGNYAVGYTLYSVGLVYRSDKIAPLTSWKDLWRPELKGRVAFPDVSTTQGPLMLRMADAAWGGKTDDYADRLCQDRRHEGQRRHVLEKQRAAGGTVRAG